MAMKRKRLRHTSLDKFVRDAGDFKCLPLYMAGLP